MCASGERLRLSIEGAKVENLSIETTVIPSIFGRAVAVRIPAPQPRDARALPLYFHGGYGVDNITYMAYIAQKHGREMLTVLYNQPRSRDVFYRLLSPEGTLSERVHRRTIRQLGPRISSPIIAEGQVHLAKDILIAIDVLGIHRIDAIGQSAGAMRVLEVARQAPERLSTVVLPYPAGIIKVDRRLLVRKASSFVRRATQARHTEHELSVQGYLGSYQHNLHTPKDIYATGENILLSHHGMPNMLWNRKEMPKTAVIAGREDDLFSPERIWPHLYPGTPLHVVPGLHGFRGRQSIVDLTIDILDDLCAA